jgi:hypothetical protein
MVMVDHSFENGFEATDAAMVRTDCRWRLLPAASKIFRRGAFESLQWGSAGDRDEAM